MEYMGTELWTKILDNMAIKKVGNISVYMFICLSVCLLIVCEFEIEIQKAPGIRDARTLAQNFHSNILNIRKTSRNSLYIYQD